MISVYWKHPQNRNTRAYPAMTYSSQDSSQHIGKLKLSSYQHPWNFVNSNKCLSCFCLISKLHFMMIGYFHGKEPAFLATYNNTIPSTNSSAKQTPRLWRNLFFFEEFFLFSFSRLIFHPKLDSVNKFHPSCTHTGKWKWTIKRPSSAFSVKKKNALIDKFSLQRERITWSS